MADDVTADDWVTLGVALLQREGPASLDVAELCGRLDCEVADFRRHFAGKGAYPMDFPLPREAERPAYRVAVVFQPPTSLAPAALCSSAALPEGGFPSSGKAEFIATRCRGDRAMTSTSGRLAVEEPGFTRGLASVARALFPLKAFKT